MNFLGFKSLICLLLSKICFVLSSFPHASLPPSQNSIAHVQTDSKDRAHESAISSRAAEDTTTLSSPSFLNEKRDDEASSDLNIFGSQPPQVEPEISLNDQLPPVENQGNFKSQLPQVEPEISLNDQLPPVENQGNFKSQPPQVEPDISLNNQPSPVENQGNPKSQPPQVQPDISLNSQLSSVENQGNPIKQDVTQKVALLGDDDIPSFPWLGGSQGEMNIGGPNPIEMLEQNVQQSVQSVKKVWNSWFNPKTEPKPECAKRVIPYGAPKLSDMFPFCCEKPFTYLGGPRKGFTGDPEQRRLSLLERQVGCVILSLVAKCDHDKVKCCYCKRESRKAGFYCRDYYDQYGNPGADARPEPASNTPKREVIPITKMLRYNANAGARSGRLSPRYAKAPHTCTADFLKYEGLTPSVRKKKPPPGAEPEPEEPPEYEDYREEDEYDDEDDFVVPEGWNSDPRHISPNQ